jgi:phosphate transport system protein
MLKHYDREVQSLQTQFSAQTARIRHNARIVLGFDPEAGLIDDKTIDQYEVAIEEECLKIIALNQPVADELRFLIVIIKSNYNFERMGDLLENIANLHLNPEQIDQDLGDAGTGELSRLFARVEATVNEAAEVIARRDGSRAMSLWNNSKEISREVYELTDQFRDCLIRGPGTPALLDGLLSLRFVQRIANNAANVAKEVLYLDTGEIVRHRRRELME